MPKMAGPWIPLPEEVIFLLEKETPLCMRLYILMLAHFYIEEVHDTDGVWVAGRIHATKYRIAKKVSNSRGYFGIEIWPRWTEIGIIEMRDGGIYLPMYYKKGDTYLQPAVIRKELQELKTRQVKMESKSGDMQKTIQNLLIALGETTETSKILENSEQPAECHHDSDDRSAIVNRPLSDRIRSLSDRPVSFKVFKDLKISLSDVNKLISGFYKKIGVSRISKPVRDKAIASFKKLQEAGFKPEEIAYALEWIPENATEPVKHFGIVAHMIDQAIAAMKEELAKAEAEESQAEERQKAEEVRERESAELQTLKEYKAKLSDAKRQKLREKALEKLNNTPGIKADYISEPLVEVMENNVIRESGVELREGDESKE